MGELIFIIFIIVAIVSKVKKQNMEIDRRNQTPHNGSTGQQIGHAMMEQMRQAAKQYGRNYQNPYGQSTAGRDAYGRIYQQPVNTTNGILDRANANVHENDVDELKTSNMVMNQSSQNAQTADSVQHVEQAAADIVNAPLLDVNTLMNIQTDSEILKQVNDLIVTGYTGNLSFDRDFVSEGVDMLNNYEIPGEAAN